MTNTSLLERYINESGYKRNFIAKQMGISAYALAMKINNESEFKAVEISILCDLLKISADDKEAIFFAI